MKVLFVHQNCPGQFRHLAPMLARDADNKVLFVTRAGRPEIPGVRKIEYAPHRAVTKGIHPYLIGAEAAVLNGQAVARVGFRLQNSGFVPDVMIGNPGWGETLFLKDVWPDAPLITLCEFYYRGRGSDVGFDPEFAGGVDTELRARARAAPHLLALDASDAAYCPTQWQKAQFPEPYHRRMEVIHDGIDVDRIKPNPSAAFTLPSGRILTREDEVVTYVARNLEPYRGFHTFMRALPRLLELRPDAQVVVVGGEDVSYGARAPEGKSWRETMLEEIGKLPERVTFTGRLPYTDYLSLLRLSSAHIYLTYPFVLSWSMLEAMSAGCLVIGSATPPVEEVIDDDKNGWLVDFFDAEALAVQAAEVLKRRDKLEHVRAAARATVLERYALKNCLRAQLALIETVRARS